MNILRVYKKKESAITTLWKYVTISFLLFYFQLLKCYSISFEIHSNIHLCFFLLFAITKSLQILWKRFLIFRIIFILTGSRRSMMKNRRWTLRWPGLIMCPLWDYYRTAVKKSQLKHLCTYTHGCTPTHVHTQLSLSNTIT
jgi:hypothetical protein